MGTLEEDTRLTQKSGKLTATLHEDWTVWSPNGGYMAALLLRAVGETSAFKSPISLTCYFLSVPALGEVDIEVSELKCTRNAEAVTFSMTQEDKLIIHGIAWSGQEVEGYEHDDSPRPNVPKPEELDSTNVISGANPPGAFWQHFEQRPISGDMHWLQKESRSPVQGDWLKFVPDDQPSGDHFVDSGQLVVLLDSYGWPAAARAHAGDGRFIAPTLSLTVDFHRPRPSGWLYSEATAPVAASGYMQSRNRIWSEQGELIASSTSQLMCRPRPGYKP